jgi:CDP-glucose 4,6-dehydratase
VVDESTALEMLDMTDFWRGRRVLVTGHTGFKGSWLSLWLIAKGAEVSGLSLEPETEPNLFDMLGLASKLDHGVGDICDARTVADRIEQTRPEIVFHLAAQSLVLRSYQAPVETWQTNVDGTLHLLDALQRTERPATAIVVTTDKVYENREWLHPYRETDRLGGRDLYSASKAAAELLVSSWRNSYAGRRQTAARDSARRKCDRRRRLFREPDCSRYRPRPGDGRHHRRPQPRRRTAVATCPRTAVRLPSACGETSHRCGVCQGLQFRTCVRQISVLLPSLVAEALRCWPGAWRDVSGGRAHHEAGLLAVASDLARLQLGWKPRWTFETAVDRTINWYRSVGKGEGAINLSLSQIAEFEAV